MKEKILPDSLLQGDHFHCQPIEESLTVRVKIISIQAENIRKLCICKARLPRSRCRLRIDDTKDLCHYWRGDGLPNGYQIVGPEAYKKSTSGWQN